MALPLAKETVVHLVIDSFVRNYAVVMEELSLEAMMEIRGGDILAVGNSETQANLLAQSGSTVTVTPDALATTPGLAIVQTGLVVQQATSSAGNV